jgi:hypothetical protein
MFTDWLTGCRRRGFTGLGARAARLAERRTGFAGGVGDLGGIEQFWALVVWDRSDEHAFGYAGYKVADICAADGRGMASR